MSNESPSARTPCCGPSGKPAQGSPAIAAVLEAFNKDSFLLPSVSKERFSYVLPNVAKACPTERAGSSRLWGSAPAHPPLGLSTCASRSPDHGPLFFPQRNLSPGFLASFPPSALPSNYLSSLSFSFSTLVLTGERASPPNGTCLQAP